jgi:hypothetical protein
MMPMLMQVTEGGHAGVDRQHDVAARPAVSTIRAAPRDVGLATERGGAVAASAARDEDPDLVSEHGRSMIATGSAGSVGARRQIEAQGVAYR